jgi:hypothetical protein
MITGLINNIQSQEIRGQLISKYQDKIETLPGIGVMIDTTYMISDIDGFFTFNAVKSYPNSILITGYMHPKLRIINLPIDYKSMDLGQIDLIEHSIISPTQYDSIRTNLIKTFKTNDLLIIKQQKADSELKSKYKPIQDWSSTVGYVVLDSITKDTMQNPFDKSATIKVDYDVNKDLITLDYNKIKK